MAVIEKRVSRSGAVSYRVKIRRKGFETLSATFDKWQQADDWAIRKEAELREQRHLGEAVAARTTVNQLIDRYLEVELPRKRSNTAFIRLALEWWRDEVGHLKLTEVTPSKLAYCRDKLSALPKRAHKFSPAADPGTTKSASTVRQYMAALSHAFTLAVTDWGWMVNNPMSKVRKPDLPPPRVRFLDEDERKRLLRACKESDCGFLYVVVVIALSTGARYGEIMNLRWRDIDLARGIARLEHTKNRERRALPLTHHALELIEDMNGKVQPEGSDLLFPRADGQKPIELRGHWYKALEAAGIEDFRFHDLRHSAASYLAMNGATLAEIAEVLGHKTLQMVKRYAHLSDQHTAAVVERMNRKIFAANDNEPLPKKKRVRSR